MRIVNAPAKINLALHVTGQRPDGYHLIDTLVVFADTLEASDTITVSQSPSDGFDVTGTAASALEATPLHDNLVIKAREHVRSSAYLANVPAPPIHISLDKRLPVASGIGGGSADAAATMRALHLHWMLDFNPAHSAAHTLAQKLGADLPMCLVARPLRATGIGELIRPLDNVPAMYMVLVNCGTEISTPAVFSALGDRENSPISGVPPNHTEFVRFLQSRTRNDLQVAAINQCPEIKQKLAMLIAQGAAVARMSGSGATCFGIFSSALEAANAADFIKRRQPDWWVVATRTGRSKG